MDIIDMERQEVESRLVSALLADPTLILQTNLKSSHFKNVEARKIFKLISELVNKSNSDVSVLSIAQADKSLKISDLLEYQQNGEFYKNGFKVLEAQLRSVHKKETIYEAMQKVNQMLTAGEEPEKMLSLLYNVGSGGENEGDNVTDIAEILADTLLDIETNYKNGGDIIGMKCGYPLLDQTINGFEKKIYTIIGARPSVGKTAFGLNLAKRLAYKNKVMFFSLEMSKKQLGYRFITSQSRISGNLVRKGKITEPQINQVMDAVSQNSKLHLKIDDSSGLTVEELIRKIIKYKKLYGLDVVIVDYLTLLDTEEKYSTDREKFNIISRKLRIMKDEQDIALICLAQLRRLDNSAREPEISDLRETGNLEQDANIIILLHRDKDEPVMQDGTQRLVVKLAKNRDGETLDLEYIFNKRTQRIDEKGILKY